MRVERSMSETRIYIQHIKITIKENYHPPLVWIEIYRPRKDRYDIILSLNGNVELADALELTSARIKELLEKLGG